jgi:hypothetical protein
VSTTTLWVVEEQNNLNLITFFLLVKSIGDFCTSLKYNEATDELAKIASSRTTVPPDIFARDLHQPSINIRADRGVDGLSLDPPPEAEAPSTGVEAMQAEDSTPPANPEPDWRIPYLDHLTQGDLPSDKIEARRIARRAKSFVIFGDSRELYRRSPTGVL